MCGTGIADPMISVGTCTAGILRTSTWEIKFRKPTNVRRDARFYFVGNVPIPREAFVEKSEGPVYSTSKDWTVVRYEPADTPLEDTGIIILHTVLTPGKALKEEVFISAAALRYTKELRTDLYRW
jgi:hypothetical protein